MHEIQPMIALRCLALLRSASGWCSATKATVAGPDSHHGRLLDSQWIHRWEGKFCKICHSPMGVEDHVQWSILQQYLRVFCSAELYAGSDSTPGYKG
jgi:hypothetical protein